MGHRILAGARADIRMIRDHIAADNPRAALAWVQGLRGRIARIGRMPGMGAPRFDLVPGLRVVPHGNYLILYREAGRDAEIVRVIHAARAWEGEARLWAPDA